MSKPFDISGRCFRVFVNYVLTISTFTQFVTQYKVVVWLCFASSDLGFTERTGAINTKGY